MPAPAEPAPGFPLWGLVLLALLFALGGALAMMTLFGLRATTALVGAVVGAVFILGFELALRRKR